MNPIQGIHHITAFASNPQANVDFYEQVLGQRLVKTTVNFDDPGTYHLYYGDKIGSPGSIMTYFPWVGARRGKRGNGEVGASAYIIGANSMGYWQNRLAEHNVPMSKIETRFGADVLPFQDPDGMSLELIGSDAPPAYHFWEDGPIPAEHALRGFHGVTLWLSKTEETADLLSKNLGYTLVEEAGPRLRFKGNPSTLGPYVDILARPGQPYGQAGAGSVHHIAFRVQDDAEQLEYLESLSQSGFRVTPVQDRQYFHSIYFRSPGGVLFEIATNPPGFSKDESVENLGQSLKLPPWLEARRQDIQRILPSFTRKSIEKAENKAVIHG